MESGVFRFKQFSVSHGSSSMKVGVDGVLIGAWGNVEGKKGLDIGCGCGLVALMCAQRNPVANIIAIDIDKPSIEEANANFRISPYSNRLTGLLLDAVAFSQEENNAAKFDFIVSNPPFFKAGISDILTTRERARHQGSLSPFSLIDIAKRLLKPSGTLSMIFPFEMLAEIENYAQDLNIERVCIISNKSEARPKRVMVQMRNGKIPYYNCKVIYLRNSSRDYSEEYRRLTGDFYLNF